MSAQMQEGFTPKSQENILTAAYCIQRLWQVTIILIAISGESKHFNLDKQCIESIDCYHLLGLIKSFFHLDHIMCNFLLQVTFYHFISSLNKFKGPKYVPVENKPKPYVLQ